MGFRQNSETLLVEDIFLEIVVICIIHINIIQDRYAIFGLGENDK